MRNNTVLSLLAIACFPQLFATEKTLTVGIVVYDGLTISEVTGPLEVFSPPPYGQHAQAFKVVLIALNKQTITSQEGLKVVPDHSFESAPQVDVLVVPGSYNEKVSSGNPKVLAFISQRAKTARFVASHCAGAFVLGRAGLLDGHKVTTYYGGQDLLQETFPKALVQDKEKHFVCDGKLITSNGALISYEASLALLKKLAGDEQVKEVSDRLHLTRLCR